MGVLFIKSAQDFSLEKALQPCAGIGFVLDGGDQAGARPAKPCAQNIGKDLVAEKQRGQGCCAERTDKLFGAAGERFSGVPAIGEIQLPAEKRHPFLVMVGKKGDPDPCG